MSPDPVEYFARYIEKETGILFQGTNLYQLVTRLEELVKQENLGSVEELARKFFTAGGPSSQLRERLLDRSTNNETLFFRDPAFFKAIENFILTEILLNDPKEIRIWSAASSTGQEALSVAMTLEELSARIPLPPFRIVATDISHRALAKAQSGVYSDFEVRRGLDVAKKERFFGPHPEGWQVRPSLQAKISYSFNNLIRSSVTEKFHLILCRNVLIYQSVEQKKLVVNQLFEQLEADGGLLLGVGETLLGVREKIQPTMVGSVIFYRKPKCELSGVAS